MKETFEYNSIFYNEVIYYLEQKWDRRLNDHEKNVLIEGYKFGRLVESEKNLINEMIRPELWGKAETKGSSL